MNRGENHLYDNLYRWQHVYKQLQDYSLDELHFGIFHVPIWTSFCLKENRQLEQNEDCIARVPIQPSVH